MKDTKIVFMGTPKFSVPVLEALIKSYHVVLVVTQKDKPVGRKQEVTPSPVKEVALKHHIKVFQPEKIRLDYEEIKKAEPDLIITCAYGQIIPEEVLKIPKIGSFNVHASLLPKYRGGSPIQYALINGDEKTGVTIMYMDKFMDSGDLIFQKECPILKSDNVGTLEEKLSLLGKDALLECLPSIIEKTNPRIPQDPEKVTFAYNLKREEERMDFQKDGKSLVNFIRALNPSPLANMLVNDEEFKVLEAYFEPKEKLEIQKVVDIRKDAIGIGVADGVLYLTKIKPFGKKALLVKDYLNGVSKEKIYDWKINLK